MNKRFESTPNQESGVEKLIIDFGANLEEALNTWQEKQSADLTIDEKTAMAVLEALPEDPIDKMLIFDEIKQKPDTRFSGNMLTGVEALLRDGASARSKLGVDWRNLMSYPDHVSKEDAKLLDKLLVLQGLPAGEDRRSRLLDLLSNGVEIGLLTRKERSSLTLRLVENL